MVKCTQIIAGSRFNTTPGSRFDDETKDMDIGPLFTHPMLLPEHGQKLAVAALPRLVLSPSAFGRLHLRLLVVLKGPLLAPAHVPALQKDLGGSTVVCADVHSELVVLQQTGGEDEEPPQVLRVQVAAAAVVVTTVQECLDDAFGGREGGQYEQRVWHHCSRHSLNGS